jgi:hypothetical protein
LTYEEILDPEKEYIPVIPDIIKKALEIPVNSTLLIRPHITKLLRENISNDIFRIRTKPLAQLNLDNTIVKMWSGPYKAMNNLGYGRNQIESVLYGRCQTSNGFKWRWLTLEEMCY